MSTEMVPNQQSPNSKLLSYRSLLSGIRITPLKIGAAVSRLAVMTGKVLSNEVLDGWIENLARYSPEKLISAFERVEREVAAFPAVSHVVQILDRAEFDEAFALVLRGLRRHGVDWKDREAWQESDKWDMTSEAAIAKGDRILVPGKVHPAEPAPIIPLRMLQALALFGQDGTAETGLRRLMRDCPAFWTESTDRETGQHSRQAALIEKDLFDCWRRAQ